MTCPERGDARGTPGGGGHSSRVLQPESHLSPPSPTAPPLPGPAHSQLGSLRRVPSLARDPRAGTLEDTLEEVKVTRGEEEKGPTDSLGPCQASGTARK